MRYKFKIKRHHMECLDSCNVQNSATLQSPIDNPHIKLFKLLMLCSISLCLLASALIRILIVLVRFFLISCRCKQKHASWFWDSYCSTYPQEACSFRENYRVCNTDSSKGGRVQSTSPLLILI